MADSEYIVDVRHVKKSFKDVQAVKGVNLTIKPGEFLALLGPNGAGKTTLVEMIEGIQHHNEGEIFIAGKQWKHHQHELHQMIGLSLQETRFMDKLTAFETMRLFASFYKLGSFRSIFNEGAGFVDVWREALVLTSIGTVSFIVGLKIFKWY